MDVMDALDQSYRQDLSVLALISSRGRKDVQGLHKPCPCLTDQPHHCLTASSSRGHGVYNLVLI